jgi:hypothetical protein
MFSKGLLLSLCLETICLRYRCRGLQLTAARPIVTLTNLPIEIFLEVLQVVNLVEIKRLRLVCRDIYLKCDLVFPRYINSVQVIEMTPRSVESLQVMSRSHYSPCVLEVRIIIPHIDETDEDDYLRGTQNDRTIRRWNKLIEHFHVQNDYVNSQQFIKPLRSAFKSLSSCRVIRVHHNQSVIPGANPRPLKGGPQTTYTNIFKINPNEPGIFDFPIISLLAATTLAPRLETVDLGDLTYMCGQTRGIDLSNYALSSITACNHTFQRLTSLRLRLCKGANSRNDNLAFLLVQTRQLKTLHLHFDNRAASLLFFPVHLPPDLSELLLSGLDASCANDDLNDIVSAASSLQQLSLLHCNLNSSWREFLRKCCSSELVILQIHLLLEPHGKIEWPDSAYNDNAGKVLKIARQKFDQFRVQILEAYIDDSFWDFVHNWWPRHDKDAWRLFVENSCGLCSNWSKPFY